MARALRGVGAGGSSTSASTLEQLDLNVLVALRALLTERHVTRAAVRIGLSQPAMSHALARLRVQLADPLLVRTPMGMQLTPRASALLEPLERVLDDLTKLLAPPEPFDPARSTRTFRIGTSDYIELVLLPTLLSKLWELAPNVSARVKSVAGIALEELDEARVDVMIGLAPLPHGPQKRGGGRQGIFAQKIISERFVCVVREDHPFIAKNQKLTLERFLSLPHALVAPRGDAGGIVDTALAKLGKRRRVAAQVPHFLVAPFLIEKTDLILTVAERVARALAPSVRLRVLAPPAELGLTGFEMSLLWHERDRGDPAHVWFRSLIASVAKGI